MLKENTKENFQLVINEIMNGKKCLSYSALSKFLQSPKHFMFYKTEKVVTKSMEQGKMFHLACLEPDKFKNRYWILDDTDKCKEIGGKSPRSTKLYKSWLLEKKSENQGKELIKKEDYDVFINMSKALRYNNATSSFFKNAIDFEKKFKFEYNNFVISGSIDIVGEDNNGKYIIDLKKVTDSSFQKIKWDIDTMNYDLQGYIYSAAENCSRYYLIYIDTACNITVVKFLPETIDRGFNKFDFSIEKFIECAEQDLWNSSYEFYNNGYYNY